MITEKTRPVGAHRLIGAIVPVAAVVVAAVAIATGAALPGPEPAGAPAQVFSAGRAYADIEQIAAAPHPTGSAEQDRVREFLVRRFTELGLSPAVDDAVSTATGDGTTVAARVRNIRVHIPGRSPTGRLLIVAHYDSVETGPGASDDGLGVSTILEVARALRAGPAPRNDIDLLVTDGEELGLMGARAYAASPAFGDPSRSVVLNLEARGTSGRVVMFQSGPHDAALIPSLTGHLPVATSLSDAVYQLLPNDTDFTVLSEAGMTGMNFAVIGRSANYHQQQDDVADVSRASLQDMGSTVLAAALHWTEADLSTVPRAGDATYFTLGGALIRYPSGLVLPFALVAVLTLAGAVWFARRRGALRLGRLASAAATLPLPLAGAAVVGWAGWTILRWIRPEYAGFLTGDPYRSGLTAAGLAALAAVVTWAWVLLAGRRSSVVEVSAAVVAWLAALGLVTAVLLPGAAYVFTWPALAGALGLALAVRLPETSPWPAVLSGLAVPPLAALLAPITVLLFSTVGLAFAAGPLVLVALGVAPVLVLVPVARRARTRLAVGSAAALVALAAVGVGVAIDRVDRNHPAPESLIYTLDADTRRARWVSTGDGGTTWIDRYVGGPHTSVEQAFPSLTHDGGWLSGQAPVVPVPQPALRVDGSRPDAGGREVRIHLGTELGTPTRLLLYADTTSGSVESVRLGSAELPGGVNRPFATSAWKWGLMFAAPPPGGVDLTLRLRGTGPLDVRVQAQTPGLPAPALGAPRPDTIDWSAENSGVTVATRAYRI